MTGWRFNTMGRNRFVLLTRRHAIKFPSLRCWRDFLYGLLNNLTEARVGGAGFPWVCPVLWASWGGFVIVMPRLPIATRAGFQAFDFEAWHAAAGFMSVEPKPDSFGLYDGRYVAVDYGWGN